MYHKGVMKHHKRVYISISYLLVFLVCKQFFILLGKKSYTIVVGKLNTAKLANFMEVDIFVLVGCTENTLVDSTQYYKPIITPYELELACNTGRYGSVTLSVSCVCLST